MTLEEALKKIDDLTKNVEDITKTFEDYKVSSENTIKDLKQEKDKAIDEKKKVMIFTEEEKNNFTSTENRMAEIIEQQREAIAKQEQEFKDYKKTQESNLENSYKNLFDKKIKEIAKGDETVEKSIRENAELIADKFTRDEDGINQIMDKAWKMTDIPKPNPLNQRFATSTPNDSGEKTSFADTPEGQSVAKAFGLNVDQPKEENK